MLTDSTSCRKQLYQLLEREIQHVTALIEALKMESTALVINAVDPLEKAIKAKQEQIQQLQNIGIEREALLLAAGYSPDSEGVDHFIHQFDSKQQISTLWQELLNLAGQCREQNRINGSVIKLGHRHLRRALDVLMGHTSRKSELYDPCGQMIEHATCRSLAQA